MKKFLVAAVLVSACSGADDSDSSTHNTTTPTNNMTAATNGGTSSNNNGVTTPVTVGDVLINEVVASGAPDWVELVNTTDKAISLDGLFLSDDADILEKGQIAAGTIVAAKGYVVIDLADDTLGFKIGSDEALFLVDSDGTTVLDQVDWQEGDSPDGKSYGRIPDSTGEFKTLDTPTSGAVNQDNAGECGNDAVEGNEVCDGTDLGGADCVDQGFASGTLTCAANCQAYVTDACAVAAGDVVINEVISTGDDTIELYNKGTTGVNLEGWYVGDSGFDPNDVAGTEDHRYVFPAGVSIAAEAYLVLTKDVEHTFGLGGQDSVTLFDSSDAVVDKVEWADGAAAVSYCRIPDGGDFRECDMASFGAAN